MLVNRMFGAVLAVAYCVVAGTGAAQDLMTHKVAENLYMLEGQGGNIGVLTGEDGVLMIDDQFENMATPIRAAIAAVGHSEAPKYLLNTHHHGDHTGGNVVFGADASIVAHENVRGRLLEGTAKPGLPVITFSESLTVHFNGETLRVLHVPTGHTDGDSIVVFEKANAIHMGDQFFSGRFPYIDLGSGGDVRGYIANVEKVLGMIDEDTKIIPGHGPLSTKADLEKFHEMLVTCADAVKAAIDAGKDVDAVKAAGVPEAYADWGWNFINNDRWLDILYESLSR